jgi:hypothetical protein
MEELPMYKKVTVKNVDPNIIDRLNQSPESFCGLKIENNGVYFFIDNPSFPISVGIINQEEVKDCIFKSFKIEKDNLLICGHEKKTMHPVLRS